MKMIIFDIDGTLRDECCGLSELTKKAVTECRKAGHCLCLCTGRSVSMIQEDVLSLPIDNLIAGGGCYITHKKKVLLDDAFPKDKAMQLKQLIEKRNAGLSMEGIHVYMNQKACDILNAMNRKKHQGSDDKQLQAYRHNEKIIYKDNLAAYQGERIHKFCLWSSEEVFQEVQQLLQIDMELAQHTKKAPENYYEIIQKGCNKADAIAKLCDYLRIDQRDTIAFGDGMNDAALLSYCHIGIAMKNSDPALFAYADAVCEAVSEDGIYHELIRRNLIGR